MEWLLMFFVLSIPPTQSVDAEKCNVEMTPRGFFSTCIGHDGNVVGFTIDRESVGGPVVWNGF